MCFACLWSLIKMPSKYSSCRATSWCCVCMRIWVVLSFSNPFPRKKAYLISFSVRVILLVSYPNFFFFFICSVCVANPVIKTWGSVLPLPFLWGFLLCCQWQHQLNVQEKPLGPNLSQESRIEQINSANNRGGNTALSWGGRISLEGSCWNNRTCISWQVIKMLGYSKPLTHRY